MPTTNLEKDREIERLREQLRMQERQTSNPQDYGIAGRQALTRLIETDFPAFVDSVEKLPTIYAERGLRAAVAYGRTIVRARLAALSVADFRTPDLTINFHRLQQWLDQGYVEIMCREDKAGWEMRTEFIEITVRIVVQASVRAIFVRGAETPAGLLPASYNGPSQ